MVIVDYSITDNNTLYSNSLNGQNGNIRDLTNMQMLTALFRSLSGFLKIVIQWCNDLSNYMTFKIKRVQYKTRPIVRGKIVVVNHGIVRIGEHVKFNCSLDSNFVGLYKTCTIAVIKNGYLEIGDNSGFSGLSLYCTSRIKIGNHVNLGGNVCVWDTDFHPLDYRDRRLPHDVSEARSSPITIGDDVFVGANSIILKGVTIGDRSIIGAGSVVSKNIPSDEIWAGNPIKFIRKNDTPS